MLSGLFGKNKPRSAKPEIESLSSAVSSSIFGVVGSRAIPPMPGAAHKAFQLATDPNAEARDFIEIIECDEALSARVLKIANSVFFDRGKKSSTIEESVTVIGINELRSLLNANTLSDIFPSRHPARTQLWANDIATALTAKTLAARLIPGKAEAAFLGGLMHDIGKLLLLQRNSEDYTKIIRAVETEGLPFCVAEERIFPFDHTQVGQLIGEKWNFTPELIKIIRFHHAPWQSDSQTAQPGISLPALVKAADIIAHSLGLGHPRTFGKFRSFAESALGEVWDNLSVPALEQKELLGQCKRTFELEYDLYSGEFGK